MKRMHIGTGSLVTGDEIADAVLDYAATLYESGRTATIGIPIVMTAESRRMPAS